MAIGMYDPRILPTIREILAEEAGLSPEKAEDSFSNTRLEMVRSSDPRTFQKWTDQANQRLTQPSLAAH